MTFKDFLNKYTYKALSQPGVIVLVDHQQFGDFILEGRIQQRYIDGKIVDTLHGILPIVAADVTEPTIVKG